jgi:hypothetical protein
MPHLECVNEEFKHYFIVDSPKRVSRSGRSFYSKLKTLLNSFLVVMV